jgi:hypothetical protein
MTRSARDRFIAAQRLRQQCHDLDENTQPITGAERDQDECSLLETRNTVPFDVDGTVEASSDGIFSSGTFFGQTGDFDGTRRRVISGDFELINDGEGIETIDVTARIAWERMVTEDVMFGYFLGGGYGESTIDRDLSGTASKANFSMGSYVVAEPVSNVYFDGFISLGMGRNDLALGNDELDVDGGYSTRSFLLGGALSGVIERDNFELRPELSVAYGRTSIGGVDLAVTAFNEAEEVTAYVKGVDFTTIRFSPELRVPLHSISDSANFVVAPSLACEWSNGEQDCGGGLRVGFSGTSQDGMTEFQVMFDADRIGETSRTGLTASITHKF